MPLGIEFEDRLAVIGTLLGVLVAFIALLTLVGLPWTTTENTVAALIQVVGIVATIAIGAVLVIVAYFEEPAEAIPGMF